MKVKILQRCSVVCEVGSIVEVSREQFNALGSFCEEVTEQKPAEKKAVKTVKKDGKKDA